MVLCISPANSVTVIPPSIAVDNSTKLRVAAYARVSGGSDDQENSLIAQMEFFEKLIKCQDDWEFVDIYSDEAISGQDMKNRPGLQRLLRDCRNGKVDKVVMKAVSRFSRNLEQILETVRALRAINIPVWFQTNDIDTGTMEDEMKLALEGLIAQNGCESVSKNMRWSYQKRMECGEFQTCKAPTGYYLMDGRQLQIDDETESTVQYIYHRYLEGVGKGRIAQELTKKEIPTRDGKSIWTDLSVGYILNNEKYVGDSLVQKTYKTDTFPYQQIRNKGEKGQRLFIDTHEAIIDKEKFDKVKQLNAYKKEKFYRPIKNCSYPLTKKLYCGICGGGYKRKVIHGITYWNCYESNNYGKQYCTSSQVPETYIYNAFCRLYNKLKLNQDEILNRMLTLLKKLRDSITLENPDVQKINRQILDLRKQNHLLHQLSGGGFVGSAIFIQKTDEIKSKIEKLDNSKSYYIDDEKTKEMLETTKRIIEVIENGPAYMDSFDKIIFKGMVEKIVIQADGQMNFHLINGLVLNGQ